MSDGMYEGYADLAAQSGWTTCADCSKWQHASLLHETAEGELVCDKCRVIRRCMALIQFEREALADDDPKGSCAAHHRGAIGAYEAVINFCKERL